MKNKDSAARDHIEFMVGTAIEQAKIAQVKAHALVGSLIPHNLIL